MPVGESSAPKKGAAVKKLIVSLVVLTTLITPTIACARHRMGGHPKATVVYGVYEIGPGNHADVWKNGWTPNEWLIEHCTNVFESTVRSNWAVEYTGYYGDTHGACSRVQSNGVAVLKIERWNFSDRTSGPYWTPVSEFDEGPCFAESYPGQPRMPWGVVNDLFGVRCPTESFGNLPDLG
jgi:hypothetical protein